ncbi:unknown [Clostridium sp. CAG:575]|nr:unknown [Clostridium sp. CAG:575]
MKERFLEAINFEGNAEKKRKLVIIMRLFLMIDLVFIISPIFKKMLKN